MIAVTGGLAVFVGVALGLLGGGGSILTVPLLAYVAGMDAKQAIATVTAGGRRDQRGRRHLAVGIAAAALTAVALAMYVACNRTGFCPLRHLVGNHRVSVAA